MEPGSDEAYRDKLPGDLPYVFNTPTHGKGAKRIIESRGTEPMPKRFIRAYCLRDPQSGREGPWLAGMTLDPGVVSEAWCHQRDYVCMIEEIGGKPIQPGQSFSAAFVVGYFDSIEEMERVYDEYAGAKSLVADEHGWRFIRSN